MGAASCVCVDRPNEDNAQVIVPKTPSKPEPHSLFTSATDDSQLNELSKKCIDSRISVLNGCWLIDDGREMVCVILDGSLTWSKAPENSYNVTFNPKGEVEIQINEDRHTAIFDCEHGGTLSWDDGDKWTRKRAPK